jgi:hypothetical protein
MTNFDPEERVRFEGKDRQLLKVVRNVMRRTPERRQFIASVVRSEEMEPWLLDAADIEKIAELPRFKER